MMAIKPQIKEALDNSISNGYEHPYHMSALSVAEDVFEKTTIVGMDIECWSDRFVAARAVEEWRKENPKP